MQHTLSIARKHLSSVVYKELRTNVICILLGWGKNKKTQGQCLRIATITKLIMASQEILILLGVVVFFFSALGMQLWGGTLYATHPALEGGERAWSTYVHMLGLEYEM